MGTPYARDVVSKPIRILIVDDDAEIREYLDLALAGPGATIQSAASMADVADEPGCDVALIDLLLEGEETGEPLISRLSAVGVRVVVMTGLSTDAPRVRQALAAGASSVLQKPFTLSAVRHELLGAGA